MLEPVSNRKSLLVCLADCAADNQACQKTVVKSRLLAQINLVLNRKFSASKSPTFHILNVTTHSEKKIGRIKGYLETSKKR